MILLILAPVAHAGRQEVTRAAKVRLLAHFSRVYHTPPQLLILGSSRAMRANPAQLRQRLHISGFNASVSSGTIPDSYAFLRLTRRLYPNARPAVLWFLDVEVLRLGGYHPYLQSVPALRRLLPRLPHPAATASAAALAGGSVSGVGTVRPRFNPDGLLTFWWHDWQRSHGRTTTAGVRSQMRTYGSIYRTGYGQPSGSAKWFAGEIVRQANELGVTPVIVLTPYHPMLRGYLSHYGWAIAYRQVRRFLRRIDKQYEVKLIDLTYLSSFGGWASGFYDGVHPRPPLMRKIMSTIIQRAGDYLRPGSEHAESGPASMAVWTPPAELTTPVALLPDPAVLGWRRTGLASAALPVRADEGSVRHGKASGGPTALAAGAAALAVVLVLGLRERGRPYRLRARLRG